MGTIDAQTPDNQPGNYYVSTRDGGRFALLLGPFRNDHQAALDMVDAVKEKYQEIDSKGVFYSFGTARRPLNDTVPDQKGLLNVYFDLPN